MNNIISSLPIRIQECKPLVDFMVENRFFSAPASTKWHGAYAGGLWAHSVCVAEQLRKLTDKYHVEWESSDSPEIIGLLHDLCKFAQYVFDADGQILSNKAEKAKGHGFYSVALLDSLGFVLTTEERECILWHMGKWTVEPYYDLAHVQNGESVFGSFKEALDGIYNLRWVCGADMIASHKLLT